MTSPLASRELSSPQTALPQRTAESAIEEGQATVLLNGKGSVFNRETEVATTLLARDYKGFGNQTGNGVIEWERKEK